RRPATEERAADAAPRQACDRRVERAEPRKAFQPEERDVRDLGGDLLLRLGVRLLRRNVHIRGAARKLIRRRLRPCLPRIEHETHRALTPTRRLQGEARERTGSPEIVAAPPAEQVPAGEHFRSVARRIEQYPHSRGAMRIESL